jgi:hypothetical protein
LEASQLADASFSVASIALPLADAHHLFHHSSRLSRVLEKKLSSTNMQPLTAGS